MVINTKSFILLFCLALQACKFLPEKSADSIFEEKGFLLNADWKEFIISERLPSDSHHLQVFHNTHGEVLRVFFFENLSKEDALKMAKERSLSIKRLFATKEAPYIGKVSVSESCLAKNSVESQVETRKDGFLLEYRLLATKNFVYGSCSETEDFFQSRYVILYCEKMKVLAEAKIFRKIGEDFHSTAPLMECK